MNEILGVKTTVGRERHDDLPFVLPLSFPGRKVFFLIYVSRGSALQEQPQLFHWHDGGQGEMWVMSLTDEWKPGDGEISLCEWPRKGSGDK